MKGRGVFGKGGFIIHNQELVEKPTSNQPLSSIIRAAQERAPKSFFREYCTLRVMRVGEEALLESEGGGVEGRDGVENGEKGMDGIIRIKFIFFFHCSVRSRPLLPLPFLFFFLGAG